VQEPPLTVEQMRALREFGDRFLQRFAPESRVVVPFRFLQMVSWIGNDVLNRGSSDEDRILYYLRSTFSGETHPGREAGRSAPRRSDREPSPKTPRLPRIGEPSDPF
jgi:hypothetical protein